MDRRVAAGAPPRSYNNTEPAFYYSEGTTDDYVDEGVDADVEEGEGGEDEQDL